MACSNKILVLYRNLIKESKQWQSYNYREYALRKVRYEFKKNKAECDPAKIEVLFNNGLENLQMIQRQVIIGKLYKAEKLVIEVKKM